MTETEKKALNQNALKMTGSGREKAECTGLPPNPA